MTIMGFDHVAIPCNDPEAILEFYGRLGFSVPTIAEWRSSVIPFFSIGFGDQKINVHAPALWQKEDFGLRGSAARPGCGDFCFVWQGEASELEKMLDDAKAPRVAGPVALVGGRGKGVSVYTRDPDGNLLEFIVYPDDRTPAA